MPTPLAPAANVALLHRYAAHHGTAIGTFVNSLAFWSKASLSL